MTELTPSPADVADLLVQMTQLDWPADEADRCRYFNILGLLDLGTLPPHDDELGSTIRFTTPLPGVEGSCTMFRDLFLGLSLLCFNEAIDHGPQARIGYSGLRDRLNRHFGPPTEEWGTPAEPACLWESGPLLLDMYCFQRLRSGVMVGPSHADRSAAYDAAHESHHSGHSPDQTG